jgi:hypothetical protein
VAQPNQPSPALLRANKSFKGSVPQGLLRRVQQLALYFGILASPNVSLAQREPESLANWKSDRASPL